MKLGKAEGTPEEMTDFFEENGLNPEDYFEKREAPLHWRWIVIPVGLIATAASLLILYPNITPKLRNLLFLCGIGGSGWLSTSVQIRYKDLRVTAIVFLTSLLILTLLPSLSSERIIDVINRLLQVN